MLPSTLPILTPSFWTQDRLQDEVVEMRESSIPLSSSAYLSLPLAHKLTHSPRVVHAFRRANANFARELEWRERDAVRQISRRVPRPTREAELNAFAGWATKPCAVSFLGAKRSAESSC